MQRDADMNLIPEQEHVPSVASHVQAESITSIPKEREGLAKRPFRSSK